MSSDKIRKITSMYKKLKFFCLSSGEMNGEENLKKKSSNYWTAGLFCNFDYFQFFLFQSPPNLLGKNLRYER